MMRPAVRCKPQEVSAVSGVLVGQPALGVDRGRAAGARGRHGLPVVPVDDVAAAKTPGMAVRVDGCSTSR